MKKQSRKPKFKELNPTYFVFCEGETEESYINHLKAKYRLPIEIDSKIAGNRITAKYIEHYKQDKFNLKKDKTYLVYDLDVPEMLNKLLAIKNATLLSSNPCFELWYLLHCQEQNVGLSSSECIYKLSAHLPDYAKGKFGYKIKSKIDDKQQKACHRAKKLTIHQNPSSQIYRLIEDLESVKQKAKNE